MGNCNTLEGEIYTLNFTKQLNKTNLSLQTNNTIEFQRSNSTKPASRVYDEINKNLNTKLLTQFGEFKPNIDILQPARSSKRSKSRNSS